MKLTKQQSDNAAALLQCLKSNGLTNQFTHAAILAITYKESMLTPQTEKSYRNTANARIRLIFGKRLANYTEDDLSKLKRNDIDFFDAVYGYKCALGKKYGNTQPGDGYKYRGRGFNQITFKDAYKRYSHAVGVDLVTDPDKLNDVAVASKALIDYFVDMFSVALKKTLALYNTTGLNNFKSLDDAVNAVYHANAGWGTSMVGDPTGGKAKAHQYAPEFLKFVQGV